MPIHAGDVSASGDSSGPASAMDVSGGIIGGGLIGGAGSLISSGVNLYSAAQNRRFQERMANTAHQREVADLRAAGLNPVLSAMGGGGANSPSGSTATVDNPLESVGHSVTSAAMSKLTAKQVENQTYATAFDVANRIASTDAQYKQNELLQQEIDRGKIVTDQMMEDLGLTKDQRAQINAKSASDKEMEVIYEKIGPWGTLILDRIFPRLLDFALPRGGGHSAKRPGAGKLRTPKNDIQKHMDKYPHMYGD